ncbi:MAG: COQ9 family protein [Alphaproteobacteria bacterium]
MVTAKKKHDDGNDPLREKILGAALKHVPFEGWTLNALQTGAEDAGLERTAAHQAFPGGVIEAIEFHSKQADARMLAALEAADLSHMKVREKVAFAIRTRLEQNAHHREAIRRALVILAVPVYAGVSLSSLYRTVDTIWHGIGDTSVDFNFYTKRMLLAGVYSTTLLHWLEDSSEGFETTWRFLDRRIDDVMRVPQFLGQFKKMFEGFPRPPFGPKPFGPGR